MKYDELCDTVMALIDASNYGDGVDAGICTACHEVVDGVEPDAERDECDACGAMAVYGAEQWLLSNVA